MPENDQRDETDQRWRELTRRKLLMLAGSVAASSIAGPALAQKGKSGPPPGRPATLSSVQSGVPPGPGLRFFTSREFRGLEAFADMLIPTDEVSGGALAAQVPKFIDERLGESLDLASRQSWREDLAEVDRISRLAFGKPFHACTYQQKAQLMDRMAKNEGSPREPVEYSFYGIKWQVTFAYYKTRIGIRDDLKYQGNVLLDEFLGTDVSRSSSARLSEAGD